jgi:hypothetical protein
MADLAHMVSNTNSKHSRFIEYPPGSTAVIFFDKIAKKFSAIDFVTPKELF